MTIAVSAETPLLRIRDATVRVGARGDITVLDGLDLEIRQGQHTAILGPNGSGKSLLIKLITQEYRPLARRDGKPVIEIFGQSRWNVQTLRMSLGLVSAEVQRDFLALALRARLQGLEVALSGFFASHGIYRHQQVTPDMLDRSWEALDLMDATSLARKPIQEMSTGEVRRVLIARALVSKPAALLLDEPTTGLDVVARHRFLDTIRHLARAGTTIVMVTHAVEEIIPEVSRIILLRAGRVLCHGATEEVLTSGVVSEAFDAPLSVERTAGGQYRVVWEPIRV